jgi:hypothetical protein
VGVAGSVRRIVVVHGGCAEPARHPVLAAASLSAFQFHGSNLPSSWFFVRPETTRSSTSVNHANGSTSFNFADYAARRTMPRRHGFEANKRLPNLSEYKLRSTRHSAWFPRAFGNAGSVGDGRDVALSLFDVMLLNVRATRCYPEAYLKADELCRTEHQRNPPELGLVR